MDSCRDASIFLRSLLMNEGFTENDAYNQMRAILLPLARRAARSERVGPASSAPGQSGKPFVTVR